MNPTIRDVFTVARWSSAAALLVAASVPYTPALAQLGYAEGGTGLVQGGTGCVRSDAWKPELAIVPCEPDSDGDGVPDLRDECPDTPEGWPVDEVGCPLDSDGDGVPDGIDQCPDTAAGVQVDEVGCPLDSDGDGVPDYLDKCPNTPLGTPVDSSGCPLTVDSDGDGVPDARDRCPNTRPGVRVTPDGCEVQQKISVPTAYFDFDSDTLKDVFRSDLATAAQRLGESRADIVRIRIIGHTDSVGPEEYNQQLSLRRANAVRDFLAEQGISPDLMYAEGRGESEPVADNSTREGRALNRRVDIFVDFSDE